MVPVFLMAATSKRDKTISLDNALLPPVSPERVRTPSQLIEAPWPEWNDTEINAEKWDVGFMLNPTIERLRQTSLTTSTPVGFENPISSACIPPSITVHEWRRALIVNPFFELLPHDVSIPELDLVSSNGHILHSEVMRHLVTSIMNLHHLAAIKPFEEFAGENYVPNGGKVWKPWNHVYAMCKVGKGTSHKPTINKSGKYIVRLYYLGKWRRITVDDSLPLDEFGRVLLPMTTRGELWPLLLSKAILRVAALSWTPSKEVVDMNAITCFTGWFMMNVECKRVPAKDVWLVCQKALMNEAEDEARYAKEQKATDAYVIGTRRNTGGGDYRSTLSMAAFNGLEEGWGAVAVFANMCDLDGVLEDEVEEIGPCVGHQVLFTEARVIRIGDDGGPLPLWKTFRWKKWALKMGIIKPDHLVNIKSLRLFAPLKKWMVPSPRSATSIHEEQARLRAIEEEQALELQMLKLEKESKHHGKGKGKGKGAGKVDKKGDPENESDKKSGKQSAESKSESKGSGKKKAVMEHFELRENTDPWMNFNVYSQYVTSLQLFFRATSFKCIKATYDFHTFLKTTPKEIPEKAVPQDKGKQKKSVPVQNTDQLISTTKYKVFRDLDYFYLTCDSPTAKKLFITVELLSPNAIAEQTAILNNIPREDGPFCSCSLLFEDFVQSLKPATSICRVDIVTAGQTTRMLTLREGQVILRIWADLPQHCFLRIASQTEFKVGTIEMVNELTSKPGSTLAMYGSQISSAFAKLTECEPDSPEQVQALEGFHSSYLPGNLEGFLVTSRNVMKFTAVMREKCEEAFILLLCNRLKYDFELFYKSLKELQVLMMAPEFGLKHLQGVDNDLYEQVMLKEHPIEDPTEKSGNSLKMDGNSLKMDGNSLDAGDFAQESSVSKEVTGKVKKKGEKTQKGKAKGKGKGKGKGKEKEEEEEEGKKEEVNPEENTAKGKKSMKKEKKSGKKDMPDKASKSDEPNNEKKPPKKQTQHVLFDDQVNSGIALMTKIIEIHPESLKHYPFRDDLRQMTVLKEYSGIAPSSPSGDWFPIARLVLNLDESAGEKVRNSIFLFSSAALCFFQITNNDTLVNKVTVVGPVCRSVFTRNNFGYTIFAYGFCDNVHIKEHTWKIHVVAHNYKDMLHRCLGVDPLNGMCISAPASPLKLKHVYGHYIPNRRNTVLRCILTVYCTQVLTIRVSSSNPQAEILMRLMRDPVDDEDALVLYEKKFAGRITLPSMPFIVEPEEDLEEQIPAVFLIEAELAHPESWPLTDEERGLVTSLKEKFQRDLLVFSSQPDVGMVMEVSQGSQGQVKRLPKSQEILPQAAYWCVQVVVDEELASKVELEMNTRKAQEIRRLKETWEKLEPGRHLRAGEARQNILDEREEELKRTGAIFANSLCQSFQLQATGVSAAQREEWKILAEDYGQAQQEMRHLDREEFDLRLGEISDKMSGICESQKKTNDIIKRHMLKNESASKGILESGYKMREDCRLKPVEKVEGTGKNEQKGKKDVQDKGKAKGKKK